VADRASYRGVDVSQNEAGTVDFVGDVTRGLPYPDRAFHTVVGLDVLEHTDDFHAGMLEMARVTAQRLVVVLPNLAHLYGRWRFLVSGRVGAKYDLPLGSVLDRHRWITVVSQTDRYMGWFAERNGFRVENGAVNDGRASALFGKLGRALRLPRSWWVWKSLYVLNRQPGS
jgi:hypothetical protein